MNPKVPKANDPGWGPSRFVKWKASEGNVFAAGDKVWVWVKAQEEDVVVKGATSNWIPVHKPFLSVALLAMCRERIGLAPMADTDPFLDSPQGQQGHPYDHARMLTEHGMAGCLGRNVFVSALLPQPFPLHPIFAGHEHRLFAPLPARALDNEASRRLASAFFGFKSQTMAAGPSEQSSYIEALRALTYNVRLGHPPGAVPHDAYRVRMRRYLSHDTARRSSTRTGATLRPGQTVETIVNHVSIFPPAIARTGFVRHASKTSEALACTFTSAREAPCSVRCLSSSSSGDDEWLPGRKFGGGRLALPFAAQSSATKRNSDAAC
ncbi:unnamed protein product [Parajaminaea phylloscopi]